MFGFRLIQCMGRILRGFLSLQHEYELFIFADYHMCL